MRVILFRSVEEEAAAAAWARPPAAPAPAAQQRKSHRLVQGHGRATFYHTAAPLMPEACRRRHCVPFAH
jgi:hypothetical protein